MGRLIVGFLVAGLVLSNCIGTDIVEDFVEARVTVANKIEVMLVNDQYQLEGLYFDNTGARQSADFNWNSSDPAVLQIDESGLVTALMPGTSTVTASVNEAMESFAVEVLDPAVVDEDSVRVIQAMEGDRTAELRTVSSYQLEGTAILRNQDGLRLILTEDFETSEALPGLYIYLTNNTASVANAQELGEVTAASGQQEYEIPQGIRINDFSHVLFYCKPFRVAVGEGEFTP